MHRPQRLGCTVPGAAFVTRHHRTEVVVDVFKAVAVEEQDRYFLVELGGAAQGADQPTFEERTVGQPGQAVVAGLVGEGFVFALQVGLPGLQFVEQGIEVIAQAVEFGDFRRRYASVKGPLASTASNWPIGSALKPGCCR